MSSKDSTMSCKASRRKKLGKRATITLVSAGLLLLLFGIGIKLYGYFANSYFYINSRWNSFCGTDDMSIATGAVLLIGTGSMVLLKKVQNKRIRGISGILCLAVFLLGWMYFLSLCGMPMMFQELSEIQSPDGKRTVVVRTSNFLESDGGDCDVYIKTNPVFIRWIPNEEQEALHYFVEPYTAVSWDDTGFTIENSGERINTYLYPAK